MTNDTLLLDREKLTGKDQPCSDYDEDCDGVRCKLACWMSDPSTGYCPYLLKEVT